MNKRNLIAWIAFAFCMCILITLIVVAISTQETGLIIYIVCTFISTMISLVVACVPSSSKVSGSEIL